MGCTKSKPKGSENGFIHGNPSGKFPYDDARKCTDRDNGLLFLLSNANTKQWAYYNDTPNYEFYITVVFPGHNSLEALGDTFLVTDPEKKSIIAKTIVRPLETKLFVQGDIDGFDAEYQAALLEEQGEKKKTNRA